MALKTLKTPNGPMAVQEVTVAGVSYPSEVVGAAQATVSVGTDGAAIAYADAAGYPEGATVLQAASGNIAANTATATLVKSADQTCYLTGFDLTFAGATAGSNVILTIVGLLGGTRSYIVVVPAGAAVAGAPIVVRFDPPLPALTVNTDIVVSVPTLGAGNTHTSLNAQGYRV